MLELAHEGRLRVSGTGKDTRVTVSDPTPLGDPLLDFAMEMLDIGGPARRASRKARALRNVDRLTAQLVDDGVLVEETRTRLGVFTVERGRRGRARRHRHEYQPVDRDERARVAPVTADAVTSAHD